jgi:hypothetical protein
MRRRLSVEGGVVGSLELDHEAAWIVTSRWALISSVCIRTEGVIASPAGEAWRAVTCTNAALALTSAVRRVSSADVRVATSVAVNVSTDETRRVPMWDTRR